MTGDRVPTSISSLLSNGPLCGWAAVQALAFIAACAFGYAALRILRDSSPTPTQGLDNFDQALPFLALALLATLIVAWRPRGLSVPVREWPRAAVAFARAHRVEIALFVLIFAFGVFMRFYRFGGTLPPPEGLCCEENINGGVAFRALEGDRPLLFLLGRWGSALGFLFFGYDSFGLRVLFPVMAVLTLVPLYLLLRQLVSAPAALFGLALYASAWWPSLRARQATEGPIEAVLFSLLLVLAIRHKSALAALGAGALAGLLSYEYEAFKIIPIVGVAFALAAACWQVAAQRPFGLAATRERSIALSRVAWRPALVFLMAAGIFVLPIYAGEREGQDIYLSSIHRNEGSTNERFKDNWRTQLKWTTQVYLPAGPNDYPTTPPRDLPDRDLFDPIAGWLGVAGLLAGVVLFARGLRLYFVAWIAVSAFAASFLLENFAAWKVLSVAPAFVVLASFFVDDVRSFIARRYSAAGPWLFAAALAGAAAFVFWYNADTLFNDVAEEAVVQRAYASEAAVIYLPCHEQRARGTDTYGVTFINYPLPGFAVPHETTDELLAAWGDSLWVCHDLDGQQLASAEEAWPLRDLPEGKVTLGFSDPLGDADGLLAGLQGVYPALPPPDVVTGAGNVFSYYGFHLDGPEALSERGLWGEYVSEDGETLLTRNDPMHDFSWDSVDIPDVPFTATWQGLIYVPGSGTRFLQAERDDAEVFVSIDGHTVAAPPAIFYPPPEPYAQGWHTIEITMSKTEPGGSFGLSWALEGGETQAVAEDDLFPLREQRGWLHERVLGQVNERDMLRMQRVDFRPHESLPLVIERGLTPELVARELFVTEERWTGVWDVAVEGGYQLRAQFRDGDLAVLIDGQLVEGGTAQAGGATQLDVFASLPAGPHTIELVHTFERRAVIGGLTLDLVAAPEGAGATLDVRPVRN